MNLNTRIQRGDLENVTKISDGETELSPVPCIAICILFRKRENQQHDMISSVVYKDSFHSSMGNGWEVNGQG